MENRREFLNRMALLTSGLLLPWQAFSSGGDQLGRVLPLRKLGSTGEEVTMLGIGGYHVGWTPQKDAQEVIETALELGVRFFDTAHDYASGESELRYGQFLTPKFKEHIFLMTKSGAKDYQSAKKELETSLTRLKVDQIDLWQLHSLSSTEDVDTRINNGVLKAVEEALKEKKIRYAGYTCHKDANAAVHMYNLTRDSGLFSTAQIPINVIDASSEISFIEKILPLAANQELGVLAMKTLADGRFFKTKTLNDDILWESENPVIPNHISVEEALQFAWSLPVSVLITGAENATMLKEKVRYAKKMISLTKNERQRLLVKLANYPLGLDVEYYKK